MVYCATHGYIKRFKNTTFTGLFTVADNLFPNGVGVIRAIWKGPRAKAKAAEKKQNRMILDATVTINRGF